MSWQMNSLSPQSLSLLRFMNPLTPQLAPQEFLMRKLPLASYPMIATAWFNSALPTVPLQAYTPFLQNWNPESAFTSPTRGPLRSMVQIFSLERPAKEAAEVEVGSFMGLAGVQIPEVLGVRLPELAAAYLQAFSKGAPEVERIEVASLAQPPAHPLSTEAHSRTNYSARSYMVLVFMSKSDQQAATLENAQQDPQVPWSLMAVTFLQSRQSQEAGLPTLGTMFSDEVILAVVSTEAVRKEESSARLRSMKAFHPSWQPGERLFKSLMRWRLKSKFCRRNDYYSALTQDFLNSALKASKVQVLWASPTATRTSRRARFFMLLIWKIKFLRLVQIALQYQAEMRTVICSIEQPGSHLPRKEG